MHTYVVQIDGYDLLHFVTLSLLQLVSCFVVSHVSSNYVWPINI